MTDFSELLSQLQSERDSTEKRLTSLNNAISVVTALVEKKVRRIRKPQRIRKARRKLSAAARKKIAAAQRARWAKVKEKAA